RDSADDEREHGDDPSGRQDQPARGVDLDRLARLGDGRDAGEALFQPRGHRLHAVPELDGNADRRDLLRPLCEGLDDVQRQHEAEVLEPVARVIDAVDRERAAGELHRLPDALAGMVAGHHRRALPVDDDESPVWKLGRVESEDERAADYEQLHIRRGLDSRLACDLDGARLRKQRPGEVGDVRLVEPEVGPADVHEVAGGAVDAIRDREEGDDETDAEPDAGSREDGPRNASPQIPRDEPEPAHDARTRSVAAALTGPPRAVTATPSTSPRKATRSTIRWRPSCACSPMPPVNASASMPPQATAIAPIAAATR